MSFSTKFVGRRDELQLLQARLAEAEPGRSQIVYIEAEAGAGKSSLLSAFIRPLSNAQVISIGGDESEALLSYGLIEQMGHGSFDPSADPMSVGTQLVEFFDQLQSNDRVVVLCIDDLQWADRLSLRALLFALRRLRGDRVLTVVSARLGEVSDPGWVRFVGGDDRVTRLRLGGLALDDLIELADALGLGTLSRRGAARLIAHTQGNALYSRALLEEIGVAGLSGDHASLPAPRQLSGVVLSRVASLSNSTQDFLAAASILGHHALVSTIAQVAEIPAPGVQVEESVAAGLLRDISNSSELAFTHPLYQAAIYADLSPATRRNLHLRAAVVTDGRSQLAHRVAATLGFDDALAIEFEQWASLARSAGELGVSAWALQQAAQLSSDGAERERRLLDAALVLLDGADNAAAEQVLNACQLSSARRDSLLGLLGVFTGSPSAESRLLSAWNLHLPENEALIGARAATSMANLMVICGRPDQAVLWSERAVNSTDPSSELQAMAITAQAYGLAAAGRSEEGLSVLRFLPDAASEVVETDALIMRGMLKVYVDDLPGAIVDLGLAAARIRDGSPSTYPGPCLSHLSDAHFRRGNWDAAVTFAQLAVALAQDTDRPLDLARAHARGAEVYARQGQWPAALTHVNAARDAAERYPQVLPVANATMAAISLASARADHEGVLAATELLRATGLVQVGGLPGMFNWRATEVDTLIALGALGEASVALDEFERAIPSSGLPSANMALARSRGNLAVARSDENEAEDHFIAARVISERMLMPFEQALLHFYDGRRLSAFNSAEGAIEQFEAAHQIFSELGADPYVQFCVAELRTLHVQAMPGSAATRLGLTRAELAVARLVVTGLTNREVANELFVSIKTVEYHLRNCYMKLNITSRRALASQLT